MRPSTSVVLLAALAAIAPLIACKDKSKDAPVPVASTSASAPKPTASVAPEPPKEAPLAWGTRPNATGPFYPVVDGMCIHAEVWTLENGALLTYGNGTGPWTRGSETTFARFIDGGLDTDDAIGKPTKKEVADQLRSAAPLTFQGSWPDPLVLYTNDHAGGRMRDYPTIWTHGAEGWNVVASHTEPSEPDYTRPVMFKGNIVYGRVPMDGNNPTESASVIFYAKTIAKDAAPLKNIGAISRANLLPRALAAGDDSLYLIGTDSKSFATNTLRIWTDGKARELSIPNEQPKILATKPSLLMMFDERKLSRLDGEKLVPVDPKLPPGSTLGSIAQAPNGDIWILSKNDKLFVHRADKANGPHTDEIPIPEPKTPAPKEAVQHWPDTGALLAGVDVDDIWVSARGGILYHLVNGALELVELPKPPFATNGRYLAQAIVVAKKGDVFVNAGYAEKGVAWKTAERYRAILRTTRPTEVLRCNEPWGGSNSGSGRGFMSFPPIADESCKTPFVILVRSSYGSGKDATVVYDKKSDFPSLRDAIKATPSLSATPLPTEAADAAAPVDPNAKIALVEVSSGTQRYVGARVPNLAAGRDLAVAVVKRVQSIAEVRPEIVCGEPKAERTVNVEIATGKVVAE